MFSRYNHIDLESYKLTPTELKVVCLHLWKIFHKESTLNRLEDAMNTVLSFLLITDSFTPRSALEQDSLAVFPACNFETATHLIRANSFMGYIKLTDALLKKQRQTKYCCCKLPIISQRHVVHLTKHGEL